MNNENKKINEKRIISFPLRLIFYFYAKEKESLTAFRIWFVCRYLADKIGAGFATISEVSKLVRLERPYVKRICKKSNLFSGIHKDRVYFSSLKKVLKARRRNYTRYGLVRCEKVTKKFYRNFISNCRLAGYICKCYLEKDLRIKKITYENYLWKNKPKKIGRCV